MTMGVIELALYVSDDGSDEVAALRPPADFKPPSSLHLVSTHAYV